MSDAPKSAAEVYAAALLGFAADLKAVDLRPNVLQYKIDGVCYTSSKLPARTGLELLPRVTTLLGSGLLRLFVTGDGESVAIDKLAAALVAVADRAMRDGLAPLVLDLLARMQVGDNPRTTAGQITPEKFDELFAGEYLHLLKVCALALAHNLRGPTFGVH